MVVVAAVVVVVVVIWVVVARMPSLCPLAHELMNCASTTDLDLIH